MCLCNKIIYLKGKISISITITKPKNFVLSNYIFYYSEFYKDNLHLKKKKFTNCTNTHCSVNPKDLLVPDSRFSFIIECLNS